MWIIHPKIRKLIGYGCFVLTSFNLFGCIIPIPADVPSDQTIQNISPELLPFIVVGQTTKEEVILKLGEPNEISDDRSRIAYYWVKNDLLAIIIAPFDVDIFERNRQYIFSITFDENNIVTDKGFYNRPIIGGNRSVKRIDRYTNSSESHNYKNVFNKEEINVGPFTSFSPGQSEFSCSTLEIIKTPKNEAFSMYIREAFISELRQIDAFYPLANITLSANLDTIDYDERTNRYLGLMITVNSSNGKYLTVWAKHEIPKTRYLLPNSCQDLAKAFLIVVQKLISNLIRSPEFPALIAPSKVD